MFGINNKLRMKIGNQKLPWKVIGLIGLAGCLYLDFKYFLTFGKFLSIMYSETHDFLTGFILTITIGFLPILAFMTGFALLFWINSIFIFLVFDL